MQKFVQTVALRWSDIDINHHVRHSVYYDWGADARLEYFRLIGMTVEKMQTLQIGVILLREECVFRREIRLGDKVTITLELLNARRDYSRWSIRHKIMKDAETLGSILTVDGAWIDMKKRKLAVPPPEMIPAFETLEKAEEFQWID